MPSYFAYILCTWCRERIQRRTVYMALHVLIAAGFAFCYWGNVCCYWHKFSQSFVEQKVVTRSFTKGLEREGSFSNIRALNAEFCIEHSGVYVGLYLTEMYVFILHALLLYEEVFWQNLWRSMCAIWDSNSRTQTSALTTKPIWMFGVYQNPPFPLGLWYFLLKHKICFFHLS